METQKDWTQYPYPERARTVLLNGNNILEKRQEILNYFQQTYQLYEDLFSLLTCDEAYYQIADPLRHPLIFYLGHTATFFINKFILMKMMTKRINPQLESLFAVGVDEMSWDDLSKKIEHWPTVAEVKAYRSKVYEVVCEVIHKLPLVLPIRWEDPAWIVLMGVEHERIHLETSSVLIRQLPLKYVKSNSRWPRCEKTSNAPINKLIPVKGGQIKLGKTVFADSYGWDNEYGEAKFSVDDFAASQFLVSNQEFLQFVEEGGYHNEKWWTEEGRSWLSYTQSVMPRFWHKETESYYLRLMSEVVLMPWDWPVEVNYLEAKAFCHWMSEKTKQPIRLPIEAEWYVLRQTIKENYPHWLNAVGNIDLCYFASSCPVNQFKQGEFYDIIGNVWQWTETNINGYHGFKVHPAYDDFSIPTLEGKHNVIKGGSWISTGNLAINESRYAFRRHFYQHAGFRYVKSDRVSFAPHVSYESDRLLSEYLEFHFGKDYFNVPNYPKKIVEIALAAFKEDQPRLKAMDLGCAVGRSSFELAKYFTSVYGIDFSARFISAAVRLKEMGYVKYAIAEEGDLSNYCECDLQGLGLTPEQAGRIQFLQGDACNLHAHLVDFDLIVASNLIDRLYDPQEFLETIYQRLKINGILVISSPYTWLSEHTEKEKWLGGFKQDGETVTTLSRMQSILCKHFKQEGDACDVEFVIRETKRKFQHTIAQVTVWRRIL